MGDGLSLPWPPFSLVLTWAVAIYVLALALSLRWMRRKPLPSTEERQAFCPSVSILKPVRGVDEDLERNLESFVTLRYPQVQVIFCARDPHDPALAVARRVAARHPERDVLILAGGEGTATNPKVLLLEHMLPHATGEIYLISDSNVCAGADDLRPLVAPFRDPKVGLVFQPVVGIGEQTTAAAMENFRLTEQAGAGMIFVKVMVGVDAVMGKGMLLRRTALATIDDFSQVRDVLAEDYMLGVEVKRAGWKLVLSHVPARAVHSRWSLGNMLSRHLRHASMRARLSPWTYLIELITNPVAIAVLPLATGGRTGALLFAGTVAAKTLIEAIVIRTLRGVWPRLHDLPLIAVKDLIMAGVWTAGVFSNKVNWRGTSYRIRMGTRLVRLDMPSEAARPATTKAAESVSRRRAA